MASAPRAAASRATRAVEARRGPGRGRWRCPRAPFHPEASSGEELVERGVHLRRPPSTRRSATAPSSREPPRAAPQVGAELRARPLLGGAAAERHARAPLRLPAAGEVAVGAGERLEERRGRPVARQVAQQEHVPAEPVAQVAPERGRPRRTASGPSTHSTRQEWSFAGARRRDEPAPALLEERRDPERARRRRRARRGRAAPRRARTRRATRRATRAANGRSAGPRARSASHSARSAVERRRARAPPRRGSGGACRRRRALRARAPRAPPPPHRARAIARSARASLSRVVPGDLARRRGGRGRRGHHAERLELGPVELRPASAPSRGVGARDRRRQRRRGARARRRPRRRGGAGAARTWSAAS